MLLDRSGKMWACRAESGRWGMSRRAVCVETMVVPFGRRTGMPCFVAVLLVHGLLRRRKWPVQPESA